MDQPGSHDPIDGEKSPGRLAEGALRALRDLGSALASVSTLSGALEHALDAALSIEGIACGGVYLTEDDALFLRAHRHLSPGFVERTRRYERDDPETRLVMAASPVFRAESGVVVTGGAATGGEGLRAGAVIPAMHEGKVVGALFAWGTFGGEIPAPARDALEAISIQIGSVVGRFRTAEELRERDRFLALLSAITLRSLEAGDMDEWLGPVTDEVAAHFGCDDCIVIGWSEARQRTMPLAATGRRTEEYQAVLELSGERTITRTVLETGRPVVADDTWDSPALSSPLARLLPGRSALGLPLLGRGARLGAIVLAWDAVRRFTDREVSTGEQAAAQISLALTRSGFPTHSRRRADAVPGTGLLDHLELLEIGESEVWRAVRFARPLHAILLELDQLPDLRARHGPGEADAILREAADRLSACVRTVDVLARAGGDAFCVLLAESGPEETAHVAGRLLAAVRGRPFISAHGEISLSASAGAGGVSSGGGEVRDLSALLSVTGAALAEARAAGGNRVVVRG